MTDIDTSIETYRERLREDRRHLELLRSIRKRYLAADPDDRRALLREWLPGCTSLTDINGSIRITKEHVDGWERTIKSLEAQS